MVAGRGNKFYSGDLSVLLDSDPPSYEYLSVSDFRITLMKMHHRRVYDECLTIYEVDSNYSYFSSFRVFSLHLLKVLMKLRPRNRNIYDLELADFAFLRLIVQIRRKLFSVL